MLPVLSGTFQVGKVGEWHIFVSSSFYEMVRSHEARAYLPGMEWLTSAALLPGFDS